MSRRKQKETTSKKFKAFILSCVATPVLATASTAAEPVNFDINEGTPLAIALNDFARQSDQPILFSTDIVRDKTTTGLTGVYEPEAGLAQLLQGSGLEFVRSESNTMLVRARAIPIAAVYQNSATETGSANAASVESVNVTGGVKDQRTGANLKGAIVEIEETGEKTRTDDRGNFRFRSVRPGPYTLRISYLGYRDIIAKIEVTSGRRFDSTFEMVGGDGGDVIVVYGSRSARAQSLNKERTAENSSTVVASDLLGNFSGTTISEGLRRVPGVAFQQDNETGDGSNVIVRGLGPELNTVTLNGIELPVSNGVDRSPTLSNILADSIESVTISKTLLPNQDSVGIGGVVEIVTKSPLDLPSRYARFSAEKAFGGGDFLEDNLVSGLVSGTFGASDQFGLSASVQYRDRKQERIEFNSESVTPGQYLPLGPGGLPNIIGQNFVDPRLTFPFEEGAANLYPADYTSDYGISDNTNLTIGASGQWQWADHTNIRVDFLRAENKSNTFTRNFSFFTFPSYTLQPVAALGGEDRYAATLPGAFDFFSSQFYSFMPDIEDTTMTYSLNGESIFDQWTFEYTGGYTNGENIFPTTIPSSFSIRNSAIGTMMISDLLSPAAIDPVEGRALSIFAPLTDSPTFPAPLFSDSAFGLINDPALNSVSSGFVTDAISSSNKRYQFDVSARYDFDGVNLKYLQAGVQWERSESERNESLNNTNYFAFFGAPTLADFGITLSDSDLASIGGPATTFGVLSREDVQAVSDQFAEIIASPTSPYFSFDLSTNPLVNDQFLRESELAPYVQGRFDIGKLEIIGGVRISRVNLEANFLRQVFVTLPDFSERPDITARLSTLVSESVTDTAVLPRFLMNYRASENLIFRGGYFRSLARPSINQLSAGQNISLGLRETSGPLFNQPSLRVNEGNPGLQPAVTDNFDIGVEFYDDQIGVMKLSFFYKQIENLIETNITEEITSLADVELPDDAEFLSLIPGNVFVTGSRPTNNNSSAKIYGIEAAIEKQFTSLPGVFSGLGMYANYTFTKSEKEQDFTWTSSPLFDDMNNFIGTQTEVVTFSGIPFDQSPKHSGTAAVTFNKFNIDASLAYSYQSARSTSGESLIVDFLPNGLGRYDGEVESLDFRTEYIIDQDFGQFRIFFEGVDLLKGDNDPSQLFGIGDFDGEPSRISGAIYRGGRSFRAGLTATF